MSISFQTLLILPFAVLGLLTGFRRGWIEEIITTVLLVLGLGLFSTTERASLVGGVVNGIVDVFARFFSALLSTNVNSPDLVRSENLWVQFLLFVLFVVIVYLIGSTFGGRSQVRTAGRIGGALLGVLNVFLVGSQAVSFINRWNPRLFERDITVTSEPNTNALISNLPTILTIVLLIGIIAFFLNLRERKR